jgi:hypothetical protein
MCVWFQNGDIRTLNECQSGHNQVLLKGKSSNTPPVNAPVHAEDILFRAGAAPAGWR